MLNMWRLCCPALRLAAGQGLFGTDNRIQTQPNLAEPAPAVEETPVTDVAPNGLAVICCASLQEAARQLGIGLSVLKRICREMGLVRWPFRKRKSLNNVMQQTKTFLVRVYLCAAHMIYTCADVSVLRLNQQSVTGPH